MYRKVTFYTTADGKCPVAEFIDSQAPKVAQKIAWVLKTVQEIEKVPKTYFKKLVDTDFYEVRVELSGMTQEQLAEKLETKKSVISRMENHSEDIRLSTLQKVAAVFGKQLKVALL